MLSVANWSPVTEKSQPDTAVKGHKETASHCSNKNSVQI